MASKKKLLTSAVALGTALALALGGTFAWQSINQTALNEASDIVNPGGRLHNDQHWVNPLTNDTNIYVENFTDPAANGDTIFARVRLEEYMELVMNYGVEDVESVETIAGAKYRIGEDGAVSETPDTTQATEKNQYKFEYAIHDFTKDFAEADEGEDDVDKTERNATSEYWTWVTGLTDEESEAVYFMPTFNKDKDSLLADLNGIYSSTLGGITKREEAQYEDYTAYTADSEAETHFAIYDGDTDKIANVTDRADLDDLIANGTDAANYASYSDKIQLVEEEHSVAKVGDTKGLIALSKWLELVGDNYDKDTHGGYWVYDDSENGDGWVYWSSPIEAGETTGLLLDSISLNHVMSDTWYYAINVVGQFVTANDLGNSDESKGALTGFYMDGETVSENAEKLLKAIGVEIGEGDDAPVKQEPRMEFELYKSIGDDTLEYTDDGEKTNITYTVNDLSGSSTVFFAKPHVYDENGNECTGIDTGMPLEYYDADVTISNVKLVTGADPYTYLVNGDCIYDKSFWGVLDSEKTETWGYPKDSGGCVFVSYDRGKVIVMGSKLKAGDELTLTYTITFATDPDDQYGIDLSETRDVTLNIKVAEQEPEAKELTIGYESGRFTAATGRATYTFTAKYGETSLAATNDLTFSVYTKGETETPLHTFQPSEITYDSGNFSVDLTDYVTFSEGSGFNDGKTELDFVLTYDDDGETKTSAVKTDSVQKTVTTLNTAGSNEVKAYLGNCIFAMVDGVVAPLSGYSVDNCPTVKVTALTSESNPNRVEEELTSDLTDEGENCKKYNFTSTQGQNAGFTVYFDYAQQQIRFAPGYGDYKVELIINDTTYSVDVFGGLPSGVM